MAPFWDRAAATIAEMSYAALIGTFSQNIGIQLEQKVSGFYRRKKDKVPDLSGFETCHMIGGWIARFNFIPQLICWYGICTKNPVMHCFENSLWGLSAFGLLCCCLYYYKHIRILPNSTEVSRMKRLLMACIICSGLF
eukprot:UN34709